MVVRYGVALATTRCCKLGHYLDHPNGSLIARSWSEDSQRLVRQLSSCACGRLALHRAAWLAGLGVAGVGGLAVAVQRVACSAASGVWTMLSLPCT